MGMRDDRAFWDAMPDRAFFGPDVRHIYFYSDVDEKTVSRLRRKVFAACRSPRTLPIVIHVHSLGGDVDAMAWLQTMFHQVSVPLCVMVDVVSMSAAVALSALAPYRVGTSCSISMLHDYSTLVSSVINHRQPTRDYLLRHDQAWELQVHSMLSKCSRLTRAQVSNLMRRDRMLDADTCLRVGIYDRVIRIAPRDTTHRLNRQEHNYACMMHSGWTRLPRTVTTSDDSCSTEKAFDSCTKEQCPGIVLQVSKLQDSHAALRVAARVALSGVPVVAVIDTTIGWWQMAAASFAACRMMSSFASLTYCPLMDTYALRKRITDIEQRVRVDRHILNHIMPTLAANTITAKEHMSASECMNIGLVDYIFPAARVTSMKTDGRGFWERLSDGDFYGPNVTHVYFYTDKITEQTVLGLRNSVLAASTTTTTTAVSTNRTSWKSSQSSQSSQLSSASQSSQSSQPSQPSQSSQSSPSSPKPIVVHVHARGNTSSGAEQWLLSTFDQVTVPICVLVDGVCTSAAVALSVAAPYRVCTPYTLTSLRDYAWNQTDVGKFMKREELLDTVSDAEQRHRRIKTLLSRRTRMAGVDLDNMLRRDRLLDATTCMRMGVYDRILFPRRRNDRKSTRMMDVNVRELLMSSGTSRLFVTCSVDSASKFDKLVGGLATYKKTRVPLPVPVPVPVPAQVPVSYAPIVYITPGSTQCADPMISLTMICRILSSPVPVVGVVDNEVSWWQMLPILFCHRRCMYEHASLDSDIVYHSSWGMRLDDVIHNVEAVRKLITRILRERAHPDPSLIADIFDRRMHLSAADCKKHGMIDEILTLTHPVVHTSKTSRTTKDGRRRKTQYATRDMQ